MRKLLIAILVLTPVAGSQSTRASRVAASRPHPVFGGDPNGQHGGTWDYATAVWEDSTPGRFQYFAADWNADGITDLVAIKRNGTGTGSTEVHILDGATNFTTFLVQTGTALGETDATARFALADWDLDGILDLFVVLKQNTGSGTTEVHVLSGASGFQEFIVHSTSGLGVTGDNWDFKVADWNLDGVPDLIGIAKSATGTNSTEIHILSGATWFQDFILHTGTPLGTTDGNWDFDMTDYNWDGYPDLVAMSKAGYGTRSTELHILDGSSGFSRFLVEEGTSLYMHPNDISYQLLYLPGRVAQVHFWNNAPGNVMHVFKSADPILYHGGYGVMGGSNSIYYIYYGNVPTETRNTLESFAALLGGSPYYAINTLYNSGNTYIANALRFGGSSATVYTHGTVVNGANVWDIVATEINAGRLPRDSHGIYFVVTAPDVRHSEKCVSGDNAACAYHTAATLGPWWASTDVKFGWIGDPQGCVFPDNGSCYLPFSPTPHAASTDAMCSFVAHETAESVTDPHLDTWYEGGGNENADKCAWRFGDVTWNGSWYYNLSLPGAHGFAQAFLVQQNWRLGDFGWCAMQP